MAQSSSDDPCRYSTAEATGSVFGRPLKSSKLANVCAPPGTYFVRVPTRNACGATAASNDITVQVG